MSLTASCPRCREGLTGRAGDVGGACPVHGVLAPLWLPDEVTYDGFTEHLQSAGGFPTYLPWPMSPGWAVTDFGVVAGTDDPDGGAVATVTCASGTSELDGPVDVFVVAEEAGVGLGARCAGLNGDDPGADFRTVPPEVKVRVESQSVPLWAVSTSDSRGDLDRSVVVGEFAGRWLWIVLRPASAVLLLRDDWILRDVSGVGPPLVEMPFGGQRPVW
jgi:hypothetical protein